jgi:hypothetical protein
VNRKYSHTASRIVSAGNRCRLYDIECICCLIVESGSQKTDTTATQS